MVAKDTTLSFPPYTVAADGVQWVVKRAAEKKDGGETENLVGYYGYLDTAIFYGVLQDAATSGHTDAQKLFDVLDKAKREIVEVLIQCSPMLVSSMNRPVDLDASTVEPEASSTTTGPESSPSQSMTTPAAKSASLPESRPPRRRRP